MLIRKFHPGIRPGQQPMLAGSGNPLFSRQGHWDGGSTLHCVAMALALLGRVNDPVWLPYHDHGNERTVWDRAWPHYLHGLTFPELAGFIAELDLGVQAACMEEEVSLLRFCGRELQAGWPILIGWQQPHPVQWHAALVAGIEGRQHQRVFAPHALLLLDPAGNSPGLAGFNARIDVCVNGQMRYLCAEAARAITCEGALALRTASPITTAVSESGCA